MPRAAAIAPAPELVEPEPEPEPIRKLRRSRRTEVLFPEALTLARLELGLTQQQAGERIGLPAEAAKRTFSFYERGQREPSPDRVEALKQLLADAISRARSNHTSPRWAFDEADWTP